MQRPDEEVLDGIQITKSPIVASAATGGMIAGGVVGMAIGSAIDKRRDRKDAESLEQLPLPEVVERPESVELGANGAFLVLTSLRLLLFKSSAMGKPKELIRELPLDAVDAVAWMARPAKYTAGRVPSILLWIGTGDGSAIRGAVIDKQALGRAARNLLGELDRRRPGVVTELA